MFLIIVGFIIGFVFALCRISMAYYRACNFDSKARELMLKYHDLGEELYKHRNLRYSAKNRRYQR